MTAAIEARPAAPPLTPTQLARRELDRVTEELQVARSHPALVAFSEAQTVLDDARVTTGEDSPRTRKARAERAALRAAAETAGNEVDRLQRRVGEAADKLQSQESYDQHVAQGMRNAWARVRRAQEAVDAHYAAWRRSLAGLDTVRAEFHAWEAEHRARTGIDPDLGEAL